MGVLVGNSLIGPSARKQLSCGSVKIETLALPSVPDSSGPTVNLKMISLSVSQSRISKR
jgi:hypothetical protein